MDYTEWGLEYLKEAEILKERLAPLKKELKSAGRDVLPALSRRIVMLEEMYFECLHTGRYLAKRGA